MTKQKLLPVWIAISSVIIIAGIVLCALLGFNYSVEKPESKTFEVEYDVVTTLNDDAFTALKNACDDAFKANKLSIIDYYDVTELDSASGGKTGGGKLVYTFSGSVSDSALQSAKESVQKEIDGNVLEIIGKNENDESLADISVSYHSNIVFKFTEPIWRGAVAVGVAMIVALIYFGIRFGVGAAVTGLTLCVHDIVLTLSLFAITRIPVYFFAPMVLGAVAAVMSLLMWLVQSLKMKENFKDPSFAGYSAQDAVTESVKTSKKLVLGIGIAMAAALVIFGITLACVGAAVGAVIFPIVTILPVGVSLYSSLVFGPTLHVHVKAHFDKLKSKSQRKRYVGKAKAKQAEED